MFKNSFSKTTVVGYLAQDPELRYTSGGTAVTSMRIPVNYQMGTGDEAKEETIWHNITAWGKMAEVIAANLLKGSMVSVDARLQTPRAWMPEGGDEPRVSLELVANEVVFMGKKVVADKPAEEQEIPF